MQSYSINLRYVIMLRYSGGTMSTIREVAALAGVSTATVSRVVNHDTTYKLTDATKEKVWQAVAQLNYKATTPPRKKALRPTNEPTASKIGCVLSVNKGKYNDPYYLSILSGLENQMQHHNCEIAFVKSGIELETPEILERTFSEKIDGLILMNTLTAPTFSYISDKVPFIVGVDTTHRTIDNITYDHYECSFMAVNHLASRGYREIGFVGGNAASFQTSRRYRGYLGAMCSLGLSVNPDWIYFSEWDDAHLIRVIEKAYHKHKLPRAIYAASDLMAMAVLRCLYDLSISVPDEIAVMGLTNLEMSKYSNPPLTTIELSSHAMGAVAADVLIHRMKGDHTPPKEIHLPAALVIRDST